MIYHAPFLDDSATLLAALVIALYLIYRLYILMRKQRLTVTDFFCIAALITVQALLLLVGATAVSIKSVTGLHSLVWILGYGLATFASLLFGFMACGYISFAPGRVLLRFLWIGLLLVEKVMLLIVLCHLLQTPIWTLHAPRMAIDLLFSLGFFGYALVVAAVGLATAIAAPQLERRLASVRT